MQHPSGRRALALVAALALGTAGSALAQDTTDMGRAPMDTTPPPVGAIDTAGTDTSGVDNPQGYRGVERDTTRIPAQGGTSDSLPGDTAAAGKGDDYRTERAPAADSTQ